MAGRRHVDRLVLLDRAGADAATRFVVGHHRREREQPAVRHIVSRIHVERVARIDPRRRRRRDLARRPLDGREQLAALPSISRRAQRHRLDWFEILGTDGGVEQHHVESIHAAQEVVRRRAEPDEIAHPVDDDATAEAVADEVQLGRRLVAPLAEDDRERLHELRETGSRHDVRAQPDRKICDPLREHRVGPVGPEGGAPEHADDQQPVRLDGGGPLGLAQPRVEAAEEILVLALGDVRGLVPAVDEDDDVAWLLLAHAPLHGRLLVREERRAVDVELIGLKEARHIGLAGQDRQVLAGIGRHARAAGEQERAEQHCDEPEDRGTDATAMRPQSIGRA